MTTSWASAVEAPHSKGRAVPAPRSTWCLPCRSSWCKREIICAPPVHFATTPSPCFLITSIGPTTLLIFASHSFTCFVDHCHAVIWLLSMSFPLLCILQLISFTSFILLVLLCMYIWPLSLPFELFVIHPLTFNILVILQIFISPGFDHTYGTLLCIHLASTFVMHSLSSAPLTHFPTCLE